MAIDLASASSLNCVPQYPPWRVGDDLSTVGVHNLRHDEGFLLLPGHLSESGELRLEEEGLGQLERFWEIYGFAQGVEAEGVLLDLEGSLPIFAF